MSDELIRANSSPVGETALQQWQEPPRPPAIAPAPSPLERPIAAIRRYKWLMVAVVVLATLGGVGATRLLHEQYEVQARIMILANNRSTDAAMGPIRSPGLLDADDWIQLLKSFAIADPVVRKLALYLSPQNPADGDMFAGFGVDNDGWRPGKYSIDLDRSRRRWTLKLSPSEVPVDSGGVADSVGRKLGFRWALTPAVFIGNGERSVGFTVSTARETAVKLIGRLQTSRQSGSNFLRLTLEDPDPTLAARILNTWTGEFVSVAADFKKRKLGEFTRTLEGQLQTTKAALDEAENELQTFRVNTIAQPKEGSPIAPGLQETRDPVIAAYFAKSVEYDDIKRDIQALRSVIANIAADSVPSEALLQIKTVAATPAAQALRQSVTDYNGAQAGLATARLNYTDEHPTVRNLLSQISTLKHEKIPQLSNELLRTLHSRELEDSVRLDAMKGTLQQIPPRMIEEERLKRNRDIAATLYTDLQSRHSGATLGEASSTPDVVVMDSAIAPLQPTKNTAPRVLLMAIVGGIGGALALAILLDQLDGRLRYPEQATDELGLAVAGTVPQFPKGGVDRNSTEQMYQLVESFRSLRMTVLQASRERTVAIAVSSPSPSEGKSLISANLAMSFADAGFRTVLVDGDTRRGALNEMFGLNASPGLTDYLMGDASLERVAYRTSHPALTVIPAGLRRRRSPELLTSPRLTELVAQLRARHDVVIFDTPPLAAGVDGYSIASATGSLLVVLRVGKTARRMAAEKLRVFDRLPVDIVGAVLNGIRLTGSYEYYGYVPGYDAAEEAETTDLTKVT